MNANDLFENFDRIANEQGPVAAAKLLVERTRQEKNYAELFEALKILHRVELGLPAVQTDLTAADGSSESSGDSDIQDQLD
ncbi:MAG: hypothetical protein ABL921_32470, partial [Pirellula sp.]